MRCHTASCRFFVHSDVQFGGYCCRKCYWRLKHVSNCKSRHGEYCERREAPQTAQVAPDLRPDWYLADYPSALGTLPKGAAANNTGASSSTSLPEAYGEATPPSAPGPSQSQAATELAIFPTEPPQRTDFQAQRDKKLDDQADRSKLARRADLYDSVYKAMSGLFSIVNKLSIEDLRVLSVACQTANSRRRALRQSISRSDTAAMKYEIHSQAGTEIQGYCNAMSQLLDERLIPEAFFSDTVAAYKNLNADFRRWLHEAAQDEGSRRP